MVAFVEGEPQPTGDGGEHLLGGVGATNYFGPFVLANLLLPRITDRVVSVTSQLHRQGRIDLDDLTWRSRKYHPMKAYYDSMFSLELQRRMTASGSPARSVLAHPGNAYVGPDGPGSIRG